MIRPSLCAAVALIAGLAAAGCTTVGPDYTRPKLDVSDTFRGQTADTALAASIADEPWADVFVDEPLRELITTALTQNYDLRIAASRVLQARAQYGITRSNQFPSIDAAALGQGQRTSIGTNDGEAFTTGVAQLGASVSWELDFWGKFRRATEAARADILATEWGRRAVVTSVVSDVAAGYYALLSLDLEMGIATRTLASREESLGITRIRESGGATSLVDVRQAEQLVLGARATIIDLQRRIEQQENFISLLLGNNPGPVSRGRSLTEQPHPPARHPAGRAAAGRRECRHRSGEGGVLSTGDADRLGRHREYRADRAVFRARGSVDGCSLRGPAALQRGTSPFRRGTRERAPGGGVARLSADREVGVS
jgi:outer membrane protein, multidrug efflux system